jgi:predicted nucleic acid-binding protein
MSRTLLPLAGFEVTFNGRFWVTTEAGDKHLLSLKSYENIRIVTPRVFRDLL